MRRRRRASRPLDRQGARVALAPSPPKPRLADTTYVPTAEGWLFPAVVLDLLTRKIVGWSMRDQLRAERPLRASSEPIECRRGSGLLDHRGLRITETSPTRRSRQKHRVGHTDCGELEARDLVIAGQTLETDLAAHRDRSAHGGDRGEDHQQDEG